MIPTIIGIFLVIGLIVFLGRMFLAIAGVMIAFGLWHVGEWWSMPLGVIVFFSMLYFTTLWD